MTRIWSATDTTEPVTDTMMEQFGNAATYNVINGCAPSYSGANLDVTVAAGTITHNGISVAVAGSSVTLVADGSQPRWSWVALNSTGVAVLVSGTPAANPTVPELGDYVEVALVYVTAGATVASSLTSMDKRLIAPIPADSVTVSLGSNVTTTSTTLGDVTGLNAAVAANTTYVFRALIHYFAAAANDYKFGITIPAGATIHAMVTYINISGVGTVGAITASGGSISANGNSATLAGVIVVAGSLIVAGTAGSLQMQHALNSGTGTNTTVAKSRIELF